MGSPDFSPISLSPEEELLAKYRDDEAKMGYSPLPVTVAAGLISGAVIWLLPLCWLLVNLIIGLLSGARGASFGKNLLPLIVSPPGRLWLTLTISLGLVSALARRESVRNGLFWYLPWDRGTPIRLGLDDLVAASAGTILLWLALVYAGAGRLMYWLLLAPVPGLLLHAIWESVYTPIIRRLGRASDPDRVEMLILSLQRDPHTKNLYKILSHSFDPKTGLLEVTIEAQQEAAETRLRQLLQHLGLTDLSVRHVHIKRQST